LSSNYICYTAPCTLNCTHVPRYYSLYLTQINRNKKTDRNMTTNANRNTTLPDINIFVFGYLSRKKR